jgi:hypothetical protein
MNWFVCLLLCVGCSNLEIILLNRSVAELSDPVSPLRMQKCRFITPSQDAGIILLSMGGWDTHLPFRSPDPTIW